jgi:hypothetical protein
MTLSHFHKAVRPKLEAGQPDRDAPAPAGRGHRGHHEDDRPAAALGPRLPCRRAAKRLGLGLVSEKAGTERVYRILVKKSPAKRKSTRKAA